MILNRDPVCTCGAPTTEVDHIKPVSQGGDDDWDNLQGMCHDCHAEKSVRDQHG